MVWRKAALLKLANCGVTGKMLRLLKSSYDTDPASYPALALKATNLALTSQLMRGLPQGSNESPIIFDVFIEDLIEELKKYKSGVVLKTRRTSSLLFADDIIAGTEASRPSS